MARRYIRKRVDALKYLFWSVGAYCLEHLSTILNAELVQYSIELELRSTYKWLYEGRGKHGPGLETCG